jgi:hypothetical protein
LAAAFLVFYGAGLFLRTIWPVLDQFDHTLILVALGAACLVNFGRNRTLHCAFTGPIFLVGATAAAFIETGIWNIDIRALWGVVLAATGLAFLVEWRTVAGGRTPS